jgi:uncharacterized protein
MKIFDFNIHLPFIQSNNVNNVIEQDMILTPEQLCQGFKTHYDSFKNLSGANFMLFNQDLLKNNLQSFNDLCSQNMEHHLFTNLINFHRLDILDYLELSLNQGVTSIMFNSYLQHITELDFEKILKVCQFAERNKMIICIDASYGTTKMYLYDNMKLICFIADFITSVPIVMIHSGGYRVIEAMLLALDKPNIYLDTSFSLPYYIGSSLEQDFAFVYKKIGTHRILFGSDHPYLIYSDALSQHINFFEKYEFKIAQIEDIFYNNAFGLIHEKS